VVPNSSRGDPPGGHRQFGCRPPPHICCVTGSDQGDGSLLGPAGDSASMLVSVRGEARLTIVPDSAVLAGQVTVTQSSKQEALRGTAIALDALTSELAALGGVPLTVETTRSALTWSAHSATTHPEHEPNPRTGRHEPTGRVVASVDVMVTVRDFGLLDTLGPAMARHENFHIGSVRWDVDDDNRAWPSVRASAVQAALRKGRDYAAALGAWLAGVEHIADTGLLAGSTEGVRAQRWAAATSLASASGAGDFDAPSLDPVPQELVAVVEARFRATGVSVAEA
jgi:uncharacterized protein